LFYAGRPTAVGGFVIAIIVDAVDGHAGGAIAHVSEKFFELLPSFTDGNAATAVITKPRVLRVLAPLYHRRPHSVFRRAPTAVLVITVAITGPRRPLVLPAAAAFGVAPPDRIGVDYFLAAAITPITPCGVTVNVLGGLNGSKTTKTLPGYRIS